jgi:hypothetical protein
MCEPVCNSKLAFLKNYLYDLVVHKLVSKGDVTLGLEKAENPWFKYHLELFCKILAFHVCTSLFFCTLPSC